MEKRSFKGRFCSKGAFALVELLVVVLIIGILVAVAWPQYKLVVIKSHISTILPTLKAIAQAEQVYYLTNGSYTNVISNLDVNMPSECSWLGSSYWKCGEDFLLDLNVSGVLSANWCPGKNDVALTCWNARDFIVQIFFDNKITLTCGPRNESSLGQKVCNSLVLH